jgi:hypothetical protein
LKTRNKIVLIISVAVLAIAGLFALRTYYGNKLGIFADILQDEQIIVTKLTSRGDFDNDTITNLVKQAGADYYQIQNQGTQVCGNFPETADISGLPSNSNFKLELTPVDGAPEYEVSNFTNNYYIGNDLTTTEGGGTFPLARSNDDINIDNPGFSITRGPGWIQVELDPLANPTGKNRNSVDGSITFSSGILLNANSLNYDVGDDGLEDQGNGTHSFGSDDEVTLIPEQRKVTFFLSNTNRKDTFRINYCFVPQTNLEGSISGQIDIGAIKPISKLQVNTTNFNDTRDDVLISAQISKNGTDWIAGPEINARRYNFQGTNPRDSYCFRYVKYTIKLKSSSGSSEPLGLSGLDLYAGNTCGTEQPLDPGVPDNLGAACSNGLDDDGDGKIDFEADGTGDSGCTNNMDNNETDATKICQNGSNAATNLIINIIGHKDDAGADLPKDIYIGSKTEPVLTGSNIQLVSDGVAVQDTGFQDNVVGLSVYRGDGYFFLLNKSVGLEREMIQADFAITGAKITKVINYNFDNPNDGVVEPDNSSQDEYDITPGSSTGSFTSSVRNGIDGVYIYYEYEPKIGGGCQCQDNIDNDNNGFVDYPKDFGCISPIDDEEVVSSQQLVLYPACKNGLDDDGDGKIDFPDDSGCESVVDNSEADPVKACRAGDQTNISFTVPELQITNTAEDAVEEKVITGDGKVYAKGEKIDLVVDGNAIIDNDVADLESALLIKRGPGYIYIVSKEASSTKEITEVGKLLLSGSKITKVINGSSRLGTSSPFFIGGPFELQGDEVINAIKNNDEFSVSANNLELSFASMVSGGSDSAYIYYDYNYTLAGGCQCQDGIDNDGDAKIDFPNDQGCTAAEDNDETDTIFALLSQPTRILPSLISSGPGFWILIAIILAISGFSVYLVIKNDKDKLGK